MQRIRIDFPGKFLFTTNISVRVYDVNFAGHLSNDSLEEIETDIRTLEGEILALLKEVTA